MNANIDTTRKLVELQGFYGVPDPDLQAVDLGLRIAPVVCATLAAIATLEASATLFWLLLPFAMLGAILKGHPFDVIYNHGLRHLLNGPRLPVYPVPRRFACMVASVFIIAAATSLELGAVLTGQVIGGSLVIAALVPVVTGFCIPSYFFRLVTGDRFVHRTA